MKLTKFTLKQIIKEEISKILQERPEERERATPQCKGTKIPFQGKCRYPAEIEALKSRQARLCRGTKVWYQGKCRYPGEVKEIKRQATGRRSAGKRRKSRESRQEEKNQMAMAWARYKNYLEFKKLSGAPANWRVDEVVENLEAALQHFNAALKINPKNRVANTAIFSIPKIIATLEPQPEL